jgi:F0F1-type ATP synthase epsilon subunit
MTAADAGPADRPALRVKVFSPYEIFYEGPARSLSATNAQGRFDVLPGHINFFSILSGGTVAVDTGDEPVAIPISHGVLHLRHDDATLFVFGLVQEDAGPVSG